MPSSIDIIDRYNRPTGRKSNPEEATNHGYWHRGAHAFLLTPQGRVLVQKRSADAIQRPGLLDIGVGGFVDSDELPEETAIREVKEETGLQIDANDLRLIDYAYKAVKDHLFLIFEYKHTCDESKDYRVEDEEIEEHKFIPPREVVEYLPQYYHDFWQRYTA